MYGRQRQDDDSSGCLGLHWLLDQAGGAVVCMTKHQDARRIASGRPNTLHARWGLHAWMHLSCIWGTRQWLVVSSWRGTERAAAVVAGNARDRVMGQGRSTNSSSSVMVVCRVTGARLGPPCSKRRAWRVACSAMVATMIGTYVACLLCYRVDERTTAVGMHCGGAWVYTLQAPLGSGVRPLCRS